MKACFRLLQLMSELELESLRVLVCLGLGLGLGLVTADAATTTTATTRTAICCVASRGSGCNLNLFFQLHWLCILNNSGPNTFILRLRLNELPNEGKHFNSANYLNILDAATDATINLFLVRRTVGSDNEFRHI